MRLRASLSLCVVLSAGCTLARSGTASFDGAIQPFDAGSFDAGSSDASSFDAGSDAAMSDAGVDASIGTGCDGEPDGARRSCSNACGDGFELCSAGVWGPCTVEEVERSCVITTMHCGPLDGRQVCADGRYGDCALAEVPDAELCNGRDDDCDDTIDDDAGCPCTQRFHAGTSYLFCTTPSTWTEARDACQQLGYELITPNDMAEHAFSILHAVPTVDDDWWIGGTDLETEGEWVWPGGDPYLPAWDDPEPGNYMPDLYDCAVIENGDRDVETRDRWGDLPCDRSKPYICESPR